MALWGNLLACVLVLAILLLLRVVEWWRLRRKARRVVRSAETILEREAMR